MRNDILNFHLSAEPACGCRRCCLFQCQGVRFSLPLKLTEIREPASSQKSLNSLLFNSTALLCLSQDPLTGDALRKTSLVTVFKSIVERGKHFRTFPDKFFLKPRGVFAGRAHCVSKCYCRLER